MLKEIDCKKQIKNWVEIPQIKIMESTDTAEHLNAQLVFFILALFWAFSPVRT